MLAVVLGCLIVGLVGVTAYLLVSRDERRADPPPTEPTGTTTANTTDAPVSTVRDSTAAPTDAPTATPVSGVEGSPAETAGLTEQQSRAAAAASEWLASAPTSRDAVIRYLTSERRDGLFSRADAVAAVDSLNVDWDEQAYFSAGSYLTAVDISEASLIRQLEADGFTRDQATNGVDALGADWVAEATGAAEGYADFTTISRPNMLRYLTGELQDFEPAVAEQGLSAADIDWNAEAAEAAENALEDDDTLTCQALIDKLSADSGNGFGNRFTRDEATYGAETTDAC